MDVPLLDSSVRANASNGTTGSSPRLRGGEVEILFKDLKYILNRGEGKKEKPILKGVSGCIPPSQVSAIFGPTGAGKTSLLDVLARRKRLSWIEGGIYVNGQPQISAFQRLSGYVVQEDVSCSILT
jgi:ABC-type multidrug transport system ATPase subunit